MRLRLPVLLAVLMTSVLIGTRFASAQTALSAEGCWEGSVSVSEQTDERIIVELARADGGSWAGEFHALTQTIDTDPLTNLCIDPPAVSFEVESETGGRRFGGTLAEDGLTILGHVTHRDSTYPFRLMRITDTDSPDRDIKGYWQGKLDVGGITLRLGLDVSPAPCGRLNGTLDSPDQGAEDLPLTALTLQGASLRFELKYIGGVFEGVLNEEGTEVAGQWTQRGTSIPLTLERLEGQPDYARPQEPARPYPYDEEEVVYENEEDGVELAGTLTLPRSQTPLPAVLLITGSGPQDRNEAIMGHRPFLVLADYLTRRGIAVLRVDDRGVGGSSGDMSVATTEDFADDALAGVEYLRRRPEINPKQIGLIGHSEGGLVAPMAAVRSTDVAFIVLMAGPGLIGEQILHLQGEAIARAQGASDDAISAGHALRSHMFTIVKEETDSEVIERRIRDSIDELRAELPEGQRQMLDSIMGALPEAQAEAQLEMMTRPWFRFFLSYDPAPTLLRVRCPVLAIIGEHDLQVPPDENLAAIRGALEAGRNPDYTVLELPGLNHLFQTSTTGAPSEYSRIEETIAPSALELMSEWILKHTTRS